MLAAPISLAWTQEGLLEPMTQDEADELRETRNTEQTRQLVDVIRATASKGVNIPHADTGPKTTFSVLKGQPLFPHGLEKKRHDKLIAEAISDGLLRVDEYRKGGRAAFRVLAVDT